MSKASWAAWVLAAAVIGVIAGRGIAQSSRLAVAGTVRVDGSSTVFPITEAIAEEFRKTAPSVNITVGISGTGGGFKRFTAGEIDVADASRPIKPAEQEKASQNRIEYIELPIAFDGLSIVVHPKNSWASSLTLDEVKRIFTDGSTVRTWKDVRPAWPGKPLRIYAPGTDSGTFDYFKEVVVGDKGAIRSDMSVSEDDNVLVRGVEGDENALGFFGCAYYFENKDRLRAVPIDAGGGAIAPTHETIVDGTYAPFSRPLFIYVNRRSADRPEIKAFVEFYLEHAAELAEEVGYVRLPDSIYDTARGVFASRKTGTHLMDDKGVKRAGKFVDLYR